MEKTENTTDYAADGIDLGAGDTTLAVVIDTKTKRVLCVGQLLSYSELVKAVVAEVQAYNDAPTLPSWTKHSPPEGFRCACPGANGYAPRNHPSGLGGQMSYVPAKCPQKLPCESNQQLFIGLLTQILQEQQKLVSLAQLAGR